MNGKRDGKLALRGLATVLVISAFTAVPAVAASAAAVPRTPAAPSASTAAALTGAFEAARHLPAADVAGLRAGTLHTGSAAGRQWAIASFTPARAAAAKAAADFQDGAATGVFSLTGGRWRLVRTGLYGCGDGLPAALKKAWDLGGAAACTASVATQRTAARHALDALPATARKAARAAAATTGRAGAPAATPAGFAQSIAAIALSQVGVGDSPVVSNFNGVDCDPYTTMVAGFSADSDGCGYNAAFGVENENETWCSDFNKWVWEQAGITADLNTINAGAVSYYNWAVSQGQSPQLDSGTPQAGDSIVFFSPGSFPYFADHVGIVTSVSPGGTIDMVNGDFAATPDVHVEYDTNITSLSAFAASVEGPGEQWAIVTPPATAQPPAPAGHISGPAEAVAGTTGSFQASAAVPGGGSVTGYYWTFGDGRTTNATGIAVTHYFSEPGTYTVSVTLTASTGAATTVVRTISVVSTSSAVASAPYDRIYYDPLPILQYTFTRTSSGGIAVNSWDGGAWLQLAVPGSPSATGAITALSFYLTASGSPAVAYNDGTGWTTATLAGTATGIVAATAYQVQEEPSNLFLSGPSGGLTEETTGARSGDPSRSWTSLPLPTTPATWANQIVLYAADPADASAAAAAAAAADLPAGQVTTSFATAWADTLSGQYLVLAVGTPAVAALYFNVCGWTNPSALPAGSTPFSYYLGPLNTLPGADAFVNAASDDAADTQALATDLAYYALNGALPAGVTSLPAAVGPPYACAGSPS